MQIYSTLKVKMPLHYDQIVDIKFSYIFVLIRSFPDILLNFNLLRTLQGTFCWTFISEEGNSAINFPCSKVENWSKWRQILNNTAGATEIIIKIRTAIRKKKSKNFRP